MYFCQNFIDRGQTVFNLFTSVFNEGFHAVFAGNDAKVLIGMIQGDGPSQIAVDPQEFEIPIRPL